MFWWIFFIIFYFYFLCSITHNIEIKRSSRITWKNISYFSSNVVIIRKKPIFNNNASPTLGVWSGNPSSPALVELMAKYFLQTLPRNIFAYYYDRVTCQERETCSVQFYYCLKKHPKMSVDKDDIVKFS